jgi:mannitol/fructose-specific phosphotransferase system IIA component (Ntr-type)
MELKASNKDKALREILGRLTEAQMLRPGDVNSILDYFLEREELGSTGIGEGVATPHTKHPCVTRPIVAFARSKVGIEWYALDGKPTHLVFLSLFPNHTHGLSLQILIRVSHLLKDEYMRSMLLNADMSQLQALIEDAESNL